LFHDFVPQHNNDYACVTKLLQLRVSLRFTAPRYDAYCKIWDKDAGDTQNVFCVKRQPLLELVPEQKVMFRPNPNV
jgi:hypothetical protein